MSALQAESLCHDGSMQMDGGGEGQNEPNQPESRRKLRRVVAFRVTKVAKEPPKPVQVQLSAQVRGCKDLER